MTLLKNASHFCPGICVYALCLIGTVDVVQTFDDTWTICFDKRILFRLGPRVYGLTLVRYFELRCNSVEQLCCTQKKRL
jgi:hypothetical protein